MHVLPYMEYSQGKKPYECYLIGNNIYSSIRGLLYYEIHNFLNIHDSR